MKKLSIIFVVCLGIFGALFGYVTMKNDGQEPDSFHFVLKGTLPNSVFDGQQFPIKHWKRTIGHINVKGNQFEYHGEADSAMYCNIDLGESFAYFIIEEGI